MDRYHCNVSLILLLVVVVEIDDIALLVTVETGWAPSPSLYLHILLLIWGFILKAASWTTLARRMGWIGLGVWVCVGGGHVDGAISYTPLASYHRPP